MNPQVRNFRKEDVDRVHDLGTVVAEFAADVEHKFWPKDTLERFAEDGLSFVVEDNSTIVGFILSVYQPVTRKLTWENMYLSKPYRGMGLTEECFNRSWTAAQNIGATIAEAINEANNLSAQRMCKRLGFQDAGTYHWMLKFP